MVELPGRDCGSGLVGRGVSRRVDFEIFKDSCDSQCVLSPAYGTRRELSATRLQLAGVLLCHVGPLTHLEPS